jgi:uncharacterized membrane protein YeiH
LDFIRIASGAEGVGNFRDIALGRTAKTNLHEDEFFVIAAVVDIGHLFW